MTVGQVHQNLQALKALSAASQWLERFPNVVPLAVTWIHPSDFRPTIQIDVDSVPPLGEPSVISECCGGWNVKWIFSSVNIVTVVKNVSCHIPWQELVPNAAIEEYI